MVRDPFRKSFGDGKPHCLKKGVIVAYLPSQSTTMDDRDSSEMFSPMIIETWDCTVQKVAWAEFVH